MTQINAATATAAIIRLWQWAVKVAVMALMRWKDKMSVGVPELDADHRVLIDVINRLEASSGRDGAEAVVRQALVALTRYAEFHFGREESVMTSCGYTELDGHRAEHRDFVAEIRNVTARFEAEPTAGHVDKALLDFLKRWLTHHIMIVDMAYRPIVENSRTAREAAKRFSPLDVWWS